MGKVGRGRVKPMNFAVYLGRRLQSATLSAIVILQTKTTNMENQMNSMTAYNIARDLCFVALKDKYQFAGRQVRTIAHETGTEVAEFVAHTPSANEADVRAYALIRSQLLGRHLESPDEKLARKLAEDAAKEAEVMA